MNDSDFGLTAAVWTQDVDAARALGDRVQTGTWFMNRCRLPRSRLGMGRGQGIPAVAVLCHVWLRTPDTTQVVFICASADQQD